MLTVLVGPGETLEPFRTKSQAPATSTAMVPKIGLASVGPLPRGATEAVEELERCVKAGAVLMKWLPIVQNFNPADPRCEPFYEALAARTPIIASDHPMFVGALSHEQTALVYLSSRRLS